MFAPYGGLHFFTVCVCALLIAALVAAGRSLRAHEAVMRRMLGVAALIY
jgi:predicted lysophospholipase L1 biosynthesis ABC-type transport system permease subunit